MWPCHAGMHYDLPGINEPILEALKRSSAIQQKFSLRSTFRKIQPSMRRLILNWQLMKVFVAGQPWGIVPWKSLKRYVWKRKHWQFSIIATARLTEGVGICFSSSRKEQDFWMVLINIACEYQYFTPIKLQHSHISEYDRGEIHHKMQFSEV